MPSKARQKKIMEKLNRAQKCSILGPQNLGSRGGGPGPPGPPLDPHLNILSVWDTKRPTEDAVILQQNLVRFLTNTHVKATY